MTTIDTSFKKLLSTILDTGVKYENVRRGVTRLQIPSYTFRHEFKDGFPLIGCKFTSYKNIETELEWFLSGNNDIEYLNSKGCKIWNDDAYNWYKKTSKDSILMGKDEFKAKGVGSVGRNYGVQWRDFNSTTDQIAQLIKDMKEDIMGSRLIVSAWNPSELDKTALPPCHTGFQIIGIPLNNGKFGFELHWYQRSVDTFLGLPYNVASYALLAKMLEEVTGFKAMAVQGDLKCVHLYDNQFEPAKELVESTFEGTMCELIIVDLPDGLKYNECNDVKKVHTYITGYKYAKVVSVDMVAPKEL